MEYNVTVDDQLCNFSFTQATGLHIPEFDLEAERTTWILSQQASPVSFFYLALAELLSEGGTEDRIKDTMTKFESSTPTSNLSGMARSLRMAVEACKGDIKTKETIASDSNVPEIVLAHLTKESAISVRLNLARNHHVPGTILHTLSHNREPEVLFALAANPLTPPLVLANLALKPYWDVCSLVASHPRTPKSSFEDLAHHPKKVVRESLARRKDLPDSILSILQNDPDPAVQSAAFRSQ